jgi:hypothetical protein
VIDWSILLISAAVIAGSVVLALAAHSILFTFARR